MAGAPEAVALRSGGKADVRAALLAARERTLALAGAYERALAGDGMRVAYDSGLNPPVWEWGHVAWFQEWWIARNRQRGRGVAAEPDHARAPSLLSDSDAFYDSSNVPHRSRWDLPLPDAAGTRAYLADTLDSTVALLDALPDSASDDDLYFFRLVALHEQMHAEAATYMARSVKIPLPFALNRPGPELVEGSKGRVETNAASVSLRLPAQRFLLGSPTSGFAFDNELLAQEVDIAAVEIDATPVTWARFIPFLESGSAPADTFRRSAAGWERDTPHGWQPLVPAETATHLSAPEAEGWCRWAGRRLPTEAEWECAALTLPGFAWGHTWEWTASDFTPYPGFVPHPYRDYSAPWFGTRRVLRGACPATSPWLAHVRYRNFFEPHRRDVFSGFRSAR